MSREIELSILVVNWNSLALTSAALESVIERIKDVNYEIIIVDNGSSVDASVSELPLRFPSASFIVNESNLGFSRANNQALLLAHGKYVLLLNSDTIQIENALGNSVRYMDEHPAVGALGIRHLNRDLTVQPSAFPFPDVSKQTLNLLGLAKVSPQTFDGSTERDSDWVCGSFLMIRRECLNEVGNLDERFFIYDEDIDWCCRAKESGWKIRFWPGACMIHLGAASTPLMRDKTFAHFRSRLSYIRKHHSGFLATAFYVAMMLRLFLATMKQATRLILGRASTSDLVQRYRRQMQFLLLRSSKSGC